MRSWRGHAVNSWDRREGREGGRQGRAQEKMRREICWWGRGMEGGSKRVGANSRGGGKEDGNNTKERESSLQQYPLLKKCIRVVR